MGLRIRGLGAGTGAFGFQEAYATVSDNGLNLTSVYHYRASRQTVEAQRLPLEDAANVVALAVGTAYLQVEASQSRVETAKAELESARELEAQALNRVGSGLAAEIEGFRPTRQRQTSEQPVIVAVANTEKDKPTFSRPLGVPSRQRFTITTKAPH